MDSWLAKLISAVIGMTAFVPLSTAACAQDFFGGKTISMYSGWVGGGVDNELRLDTRFLGRFVPGNPGTTAFSMPGGGGIILANYLYNIAKPDGFSIGMPGRAGYSLSGMMGEQAVKYDPSKFTYIGSLGPDNLVLFIRRGAGVQSLNDLLNVKSPVIIGGLGPGTTTTVVPQILAKYKTLSIKVIPGYAGTNEALVAMDRGEIDGNFNLSASLPPDAVSSGRVIPILQALPILPGVPLIDSLVSDNDERGLLNLALAPKGLGSPLLGPPGMPKEATEILRRAFVEMVADPEYRKAASSFNMDLRHPISGEQAQEFAANKLGRISPETIKAYQAIVGP
jgi:tripartite-type tricarboxylate transporter receptor subunit TctC